MQYLTASLEDYLEIIYILRQTRPKVGITDIADALLLSKPSVSRAVNALKLKGLAFQEKYGKINLSEEGESRAKAIYEKHKIISKFFTQVLKVSPQAAEIDACKVEHILSGETLLKIENFLNEKR